VREIIAIAMGSVLGIFSAHFVAQKSFPPPPPHVEEFQARYRSGTTPLERQAVVVRVTGEHIVLVQKEKEFSIPIAKITFVAYSDPKAKRYFAALQWSGAPRGEVVLAIDRQDYRRVVDVLRDVFQRAQFDTSAA